MICWFCGVIESDPKKALDLKLYGEIDARTTASVTKVKYILHKVDVPRCYLCKAKHRLALLALIAGAILILTSIVLIILTAFGVLSGFADGLLTGLFAGLGIGGSFYSKAVQKGIHTVPAAKRTYPEVKDLLDKGYKFGKGIKDPAREVRQSDDSIGTANDKQQDIPKG